MNQAIEAKTETRDGILWDVITADHLCRVKIQGSNEYIYAHYPENWEKVPLWLKPGNAVKIMHTGGIRGRIEIVGHGQMIPTPVSGSKFPTIATGEDCIITGCSLTQALTPRMVVLVKTGTYRIGGVTYTLGPITMGYGTNYLASDGGVIGTIAGAVAITAAPSAGNYRYDLISIGAHDGLIDLQTGTPAASPIKPTLLAGHVELGYIFIPCGATQIKNNINIGPGAELEVPTASLITMTVVDDDLAWAELTTDITVMVYDQYGNLIVGAGLGWYLTLEIISGNGAVSSLEEGSSTTKIGGHTGATSSYTFTYTRDQIDPGDLSPTIQAKCDGISSNVSHFIILRNAGGDIMR